MLNSIQAIKHSAFTLSVQNNWPLLTSIGQFFYILLLVAFVALLAYYSTKLMASSRIARRGGKQNLEIVESVGVGSQAMIQVVRAGDKFLVIGVTKERVTLLSELDESQVKLSSTGKLLPDDAFEKVLQRFLHRDKSGQDTE